MNEIVEAMEKTEEPVKVECKICGREFKRIQSLNAHMSIHKVKIDITQECKICNEEFENLRNLAIHLRRHKTISSQEYYDKFLIKNELEKVCLYCGKKNRYCGLVGYTDYCSPKCASLGTRKIASDKWMELYNVDNPSKLPIIKQKISEAHSRKSQEEKKAINDKRVKTTRDLYDADNVFQLEYFQNKYINTCQERYKVNNSFCIQEVKDQIRDYRSKNPVLTCWQLEYWTNKGFSEDESKKIISERASRKLSFFITKYGTEDGTIKYNQMIEKRKFSYSLEGFIFKYGEELGTEKYHAVINSKLISCGAISKISKKLFDRFYDYVISKNIKITLIREHPLSYYQVDCYIPEYNCIIEFYGDYWHANKELNMIFIDEETTNKKIYLDGERIDHLIKHDDVKKIIIVWEWVFRKCDENVYFSEILNFILANDENNYLELNYQNDNTIKKDIKKIC